MKQLSYYSAYIVGYGLLFLMLYDTITWGFVFPVHDGLFFATTIFMIILGLTWVVTILPKHFLALGYDQKVRTLKTQARLLYGHQYQPYVSVIIPAYNEEVGILSTLKTLIKSTYRRMEVIIIDDGSQDRTGQTVQQFIFQYQQSCPFSPIPLTYYIKPNGGKGSALNYGIQRARGEIICTFDADSIVDAQCIERFVSYFVEPTIMACSGNIKIGNRHTFVSLIQHLEYILGFQMKKAEALLGTIFVIGGAAAAYRREVFTQLGGFIPSMLTEDMELSFRIQQSGMRIFYAHDALVYTEGPTTFQALFKQRLRWKRGAMETLRLYSSSFFSRSLKNTRFFWLTLPFTILQYIEFVFSLIGMFLVGIYCLLAFNFEPILAMVLLTGGIYLLLFLSDRTERHLSSFLLVPISWCFFYGVGIVEGYVIVRAFLGLLLRQKVQWQTWQRQGVITR